jgi:hypothetical protein
MTIITVTAPTVYQYNSLMAFNLEKVNKNPYSSESIAYQIFDEIEDAQEYLRTLANDYYDFDEQKVFDNLSNYHLTIDACTARIIEGDEALKFMESDNRNH